MWSSILLTAAAVASATAHKDIEVVLAHYEEDLSWTKAYKRSGAEFTIYSKAEDATRVPQGALELPNVGRESHTYLHHIVSRYENLAEWTVFSQAGAPSHGYRGAGMGGGHLVGSVGFEDYLKPNEDSTFIFSSATELPSLRHSLRLDFAIDDLDMASDEMCPEDGVQGWTKWFDLGSLGSWLENKRRNQKGMMALQYYRTLVAQTPVSRKPVTLSFAQGARFAVSRKQILSRPLAYYEALLDTVSGDIDPIAGYWLEYMWYDVFHPEAIQETTGVMCDVPVDEETLSRADMIEELQLRMGMTLHDRRSLSTSGGVSGGVTICANDDALVTDAIITGGMSCSDTQTMADLAAESDDFCQYTEDAGYLATAYGAAYDGCCENGPKCDAEVFHFCTADSEFQPASIVSISCDITEAKCLEAGLEYEGSCAVETVEECTGAGGTVTSQMSCAMYGATLASQGEDDSSLTDYASCNSYTPQGEMMQGGDIVIESMVFAERCCSSGTSVCSINPPDFGALLCQDAKNYGGDNAFQDTTCDNFLLMLGADADDFEVPCDDDEAITTLEVCCNNQLNVCDVEPTLAPTIAPTLPQDEEEAVAEVEVAIELGELAIEEDDEEAIADMEEVLIKALYRTLGYEEGEVTITGQLVAVTSRRQLEEGVQRRLATEWTFESTVTIPYSTAAVVNEDDIESSDPAEAMAEVAEALEEQITEAVAASSDSSNDESFAALLEDELETAVQEAANNGETFAGMADVGDVATAMTEIADNIEVEVETVVVEGTDAPTPALPEDDDEIAGLKQGAFYSVVIVVPIVGLAIIAAVGYFAASKANNNAAANQFRNVQMT